MRFASILPVVALTAFCTAPAHAQIISLTAAVRDFKGFDEPGGHIDFENGIGAAPNIVETTLGTDGKPVYALGADGTGGGTHGQAAFDQWFRDVPGTNLAGQTTLVLDNGQPGAGGTYVFSAPEFFPIDGQLFGNTPNTTRNFHFTLELHAEFVYRGGETLTLGSDDDSWLFIDRRLAVDLGGTHPTQSAELALDSLGLTVGNTYAFDLFFAERHTTGSTLTLATNAVLTQPVPAPIPLVLLLSGLAGVWRRRTA